MGDSPMAKPASRFRKPKPVEILRTDRLCSVLETRYHTTKPTIPTTITWYSSARVAGSFQERRLREGAGAETVCLVMECRAGEAPSRLPELTGRPVDGRAPELLLR